MEPLNIQDVLMWLISGGGSVLAASWILERVVAYQKMSSTVKEWIFFGVSSTLGVGAYALVTYFPDLLLSLQPYFAIVAGTFVLVFMGKTFHSIDKREKEVPEG